MPLEQRRKTIRSLRPEEAKRLLFDWGFWSRPEQRAPAGDWQVWLVCAGRGFGKTRSGAEWVRDRVESGLAKRIALVGRTAADGRDVIVEGESGILAVCPPWNKPKYEPSKRRVTWPSGAMATVYSADEPATLRGPQHDTAWADELASWQYTDAWDQLQFGLRLGDDPRVCVTTTPRPTPLIRQFLTEASPGGTTRVTRGSTYDNAGNLAPSFLSKIVAKYKGTRLGRQELNAEVLDDAPGALWNRTQLDLLRADPKKVPLISTIVIGVDPATTRGEHSNETGIVIVGLGVDGHGYVFKDRSGRYSPDTWGKIVVDEYKARKANRIIAERNQGGDLVESNIQTVANLRDTTVSVTTVHASQGKRTRAEPVSALYEQGRVHHVGVLAELEDQMCTWEPDLVTEDGPRKKILKSDSPDRIDALVWALTYLMVDRNPKPRRSQGVVVPGVLLDDRPVGD